jgi:hypothetical protein
MEDTTENLDFFLSGKIIIFKTFYYRGENNSRQMDITKLLEIQGENRQLSEQELQGLYIYLSMQFDQMSNEQKLFWIETMKNLDPDFNKIEDDEEIQA